MCSSEKEFKQYRTEFLFSLNPKYIDFFQKTSISSPQFITTVLILDHIYPKIPHYKM